MKKIGIILSLTMILSATNVFAHPHYYNDYYHDSYYHNHYTSCHNCTYVVRSDSYQEKQNFQNCDKHSLLIDTTVNYYSNGSRRSFNTYTVLNKDGSVLISNCYDIKHFIYNKNHYFIAKEGKYYKIIDDKGNNLTFKNYTKMNEIAQNKFQVVLDKKYGVIDLNENIIIPIKYKEFEQIGIDTFLTKLNGYFGIIDSSNNIILNNEFDKIKPLHDVFLIKKYKKYGLISSDGKMILECEYNKIKKFDEYILVEKDNKQGLFDSFGVQLSEIKYKDIKLERNTIKVKENKIWENL